MHFRPEVEATLTGTSCTIEPAWTPHIPLGGSACGCSHYCCCGDIYMVVAVVVIVVVVVVGVVVGVVVVVVRW